MQLIPLPDDVPVLADWEPTGDPPTDAAAAAVINVQRAQWAVMVAGDLDAVRYRDYITGGAEQIIFEDFVRPFVEDGRSVAGTDRIFDFEVSDVTNRSATVEFCNDQSDLNLIDRVTSKVVRLDPPPAGDYRVAQTVELVGGRWKVTSDFSQGGVEACDIVS